MSEGKTVDVGTATGWPPGHLLGKPVRVTLVRPDDQGGPARIVEGKLLAFDEGGECVVLRDDGFVAYCWPMLEVGEVKTEA